MARRRRRDDGPQPISASIKDAAARFGTGALLGLAEVNEHWERVVGEPMGSHARPVRVVDTTLVVAVDQPLWATQVTLYQAELLARLADVVSTPITQIDVVVRAAQRPRE